MTATRIIRVQVPDGFATVKAAPTPVPGLMINEGPGHGGCWNITHLASGTAVAAYFEDPEHALHVAVQLGPLCDWTLPGVELLKLMSELRREWLRVMAEAGALEHLPGGQSTVRRIAEMEPLS